MGGNCHFILFVQETMTGRDKVNVGDRCGLSAAIKYFGAHQSYEYFVEDGVFCGDDDKLFEILTSHSRVYYDEKEGDFKDKKTLKTKAFSHILTDFVCKRSKDKKFKFYKGASKM